MVCGKGKKRKMKDVERRKEGRGHSRGQRTDTPPAYYQGGRGMRRYMACCNGKRGGTQGRRHSQG